MSFPPAVRVTRSTAAVRDSICGGKLRLKSLGLRVDGAHRLETVAPMTGYRERLPTPGAV